MNKNFLAGLTLILFLLTPVFIVNGVQAASNNLDSTSSDINFNNRVYDKDLEWYLINYPSSKDIPVIILFKPDVSAVLGSELLNLQGYRSLIIKYVYDSINGVACKLSKHDLLNVLELYFIKTVYLDKEYSFELPETSITASNIEALYSSGLEAIDALPLQSNYTGSGVKIAILDSGLSLTHPDFADRIIASRSFVEDENATDLNGHGTHVAGIAAGSGLASGGLYKGVAPGAQLINAKCAQISGIALTSDVIAAIEWSVNEQYADVLSISLGGGVGDPEAPLSKAVDWAADQGAIVAISAGNSGPDYASVASPAAAKRVIAVGASNYDDRIVDFSSRGPTVDDRISPDLVAPGYQVISTLAKDSVIDLVSQYYLSPDPRISGSGVYSNSYYYIALSGTSMASPFVSGAVALLLSAFPNLKGNPEAIKSALMNTAVKLTNSSGVEYSPNIQGSGRLNVTAAYYYLLTLNTSTNYIPTTSILPCEVPVEPFQIMYPGQEVNLIVKFLTGQPLNISIVNAPANASMFLRFGNGSYLTNNTWNVSVENYLDIFLNLKLPLNITPGFYTGRIEIFNRSDGSSLHNITVSFQAKIPLARIYFDLLHNDDYDDTPLRNYRLFFNILMNDGYAVFSGDNLLTYEFVKNFDLIILPDIEIQLLSFEVEALQKYVAEGGCLLILGSFYPMTVSEGLNPLTSIYGIQYSEGYAGNLLSYTDLGLAREYENLIVNTIISDPITQGVSSYTFGSGLSLTVSSPAKILATLNGEPVLASYDNTSITGGRVVVFSNELTFYSDNLQSTIYDNLKLVRNTLDWLLKETSTLLTVSAENNIVELSGSHTESVYIYLSYNGLPVEGLISGVNLNATLNGSINLNITELGFGVYTTNFTVSSPCVYKINVQVNNGTVSGFDSTQIIVVDNLPALNSVAFTKAGSIQTGVSYPYWVELEDFNSSLLISKFGERMVINVTAVNADNILLVANSDPQQFYELTNRNITYICDNMSYLAGLNWSYMITPNSSYTAASYPIIIIPLNTSQPSINPTGFIIKTILIVGAEPEIDAEKTMVNNTPIDNLQKYNIGGGETIPIYYYSFGSTVQLSTTGSDIQDTVTDMKAYVWIIDALLYYYLGQPLYVIELHYDSLNQAFTGNLLISSYVISGPAGSVALKTNWAYNLMFFLVNSEGDFTQGPQTLLVFQQGFGFLPSPFILILIGLLLITLPFYVMQRRRIRKSMQETEQAYKPYIEEPFLEESTLPPRFCPYCGAKVNYGDIYCLSCGSLLPEEGPAPSG